MLLLSFDNVVIDGGNLLEALFLSYFGELWIELLSLAVLTISGSLEVLSCGADDTSRIRSSDL